MLHIEYVLDRDCLPARGTKIEKLYTADKLAKLNATAAKREEKRLAAIRTKQQIEATAKAARTADFEREHGELLASNHHQPGCGAIAPLPAEA